MERKTNVDLLYTLSDHENPNLIIRIIQSSTKLMWAGALFDAETSDQKMRFHDTKRQT